MFSGKYVINDEIILRVCVQVIVQNLIITTWSMLSKSLLLRAVESGDLVELPTSGLVFKFFLSSINVYWRPVMSLAFSCHQRDIVLIKTKNISPKKLKFSREKSKKEK